MAKKRVNITITEETQERILQYAYENHLQGGLSGAIEHIAWQVLKVKNAQIRGQSSIKFDKQRHEATQEGENEWIQNDGGQLQAVSEAGEN